MSAVDFEVLKVLLDNRYYEILKQLKKAFNSTLTEHFIFLIY